MAPRALLISLLGVLRLGRPFEPCRRPAGHQPSLRCGRGWAPRRLRPSVALALPRLTEQHLGCLSWCLCKDATDLH
jgi:hypothetical protein